LDEANKIATLVWAYSHPDVDGNPVYFDAMGSVQRLPNGNTLIGWGWDYQHSGFPNITEVKPDSTIVWEAVFTDSKNLVSYRARKYEWNPCARSTFKLMKESSVTDSTATLNWSPATHAVTYLLQWRAAGSTIWNEHYLNVPHTAWTLHNLNPSTTYFWRLQTWCDTAGNTTSGFTTVRKFNTLPFRLLDVAEAENNFSVFPNPVKDRINVLFMNDYPGIISLQLFDLLGRNLLNKTFQADKGEINLQLPLENIGSGNYLLEIITPAEKCMSKVVIQ
jgi:hypothetical protein